jgi:two-component system chemotaxis sensor kinase CheA
MKSDMNEETEDLDSLQSDIEETSFGEFDEEDDMTIEELLDGDAVDDTADAGHETASSTGDGTRSEPAAVSEVSDTVDSDPTHTAGTAPSPDTGSTAPDDGGVTTDAATFNGVDPDELIAAAEADTTASSGGPVADDERAPATESPGQRSESETGVEPEPEPEPEPDPESEAGVGDDLGPDRDPAQQTASDSDPASDTAPAASETAADDGDGDGRSALADVLSAMDAAGDAENEADAGSASTTDPRSGSDGTATESRTSTTVASTADDPERSGARASAGTGTGDGGGETVVAPDTAPSLDVDLGETATDVTDTGDAASTFERRSDVADFESRFGQLFEDAETEGPGGRPVATIAASTLETAAFEAADRSRPRETGSGDLGSLRVDVERADDLLRHLREFERARLRLEETVTDPEALSAVQTLDTAVTEYKSTVMDVRLMPLSRATEGLARVARDTARGTDTRVEFRTSGTDVSLDRDVIDTIRDPLVHLVRNAVDHGIETAAEREAAGKSPEGVVEVRARRDGDEAAIEVADDGGGMDPARIRETAVERGVLSRREAADLSVAESYELLFEPGFSTASEVTATSGRGVGMDVVRRTMEELNGTVEVETESGVGTTIRMRVPVSVVVSDVVFAEVGAETYAVPTAEIDGITRLEGLRSGADGETVLVGDERVPLVRLSEAFGVPGADEQMVLRVAGERPRAFAVDDVGDKREVVVTPYEDLLGGIPGLGGAAFLGETNVVNVIDIETV